MKNTLRLFGIIALIAIFGFSMAACSNGSTGGGGGSKSTVTDTTGGTTTVTPTEKNISAKWNVSGDNTYSSFEFTEDNVYLVQLKGNQAVPRNIQVSESVNAEIFGGSINAVVTGTSNVGKYYTGKYTIKGNTITLEDFGVLVVMTLTTDSFKFTFKYGNSGNTIQYNAAKNKDQNQITSTSSQTNMLCRNWKIVDASSSSYIGYTVLFSRAGTYLFTTTRGETQLAGWRWKANTQEKQFEYSLYNWAASSIGTAVIHELTATKLRMTDGANITYELELVK